jgi:uncharacterized protein YndB with AHSA1/START domain
MPTFEEVAESAAPPEEVWKLLYDPEQFERWWGCFEAGDVPQPSSHAAFPLPQVVSSDRGDGRIIVSCLVRDISFEWQLAERPEGGTRIELRLTVPESYGFRTETQRGLIAFSVARLARLAEELAPA